MLEVVYRSRLSLFMTANLLWHYSLHCIAFYRTTLCIRGTSHGPVSVCVCPSVRLSQVGVLLKRLNVRSHKQQHTIARDSSFLTPKISAKFDRSHPLRGRQMQVGWVKIGNFRQITDYISKTVKDGRMVSIKVEKEVVCALSNLETSNLVH